MMSFLETGRALYLLAAICLGGIMVKLAAGSFYKRLIREKLQSGACKKPVSARPAPECGGYIQDQYGNEQHQSISGTPDLQPAFYGDQPSGI